MNSKSTEEPSTAVSQDCRRIDGLADQVNRLKEEVRKQKRPWYKRASDILSLLAILVTAAIGMSHWSQLQQSAGVEERRHLSAIFNEIGSVHLQMTQVLALPVPYHQKEFAGYALQNQLLTLLRDADRIASKFDDDLTELERAVLAAAFAQIDDLDRAERYMSGFLKTNTSPLYQAIGYRSFANMSVRKGPKHFKKAHDNYAKAIEVLKNMDSLSAGVERANVHSMNARLYLADHRPSFAKESLEKAWQAILGLPCMERFELIVAEIRRYSLIVEVKEPSEFLKTCVFYQKEREGTKDRKLPMPSAAGG